MNHDHLTSESMNVNHNADPMTASRAIDRSIHPLTVKPTTLGEDAFKKDRTTVFGFWMYLMTDLVLFASLFSVYAVLRANTFGGPAGIDIFSGSFVLIETAILLLSSFTCGITLLCARAGKKDWVVAWLVVTACLGLAFVTLEFSEFAKLILAGNGWQRSGFLSSYFALVGTHGLHIVIGLLWIITLIISISRKGLTRGNMRKLMLWSMFWHFLDIVWIFIFTLVYLLTLLHV